jgi:hypothetical protein
MGADISYQMNRDALLLGAGGIDACDAFRIEAGGSRHRCADCDESIAAHIVVALRARLAENCGSCAHGNDRDAVVPSLNTFCTKRFGFFNGKPMPKTARCESWAKAPGCRECEDTRLIEVTYNSDPTTSRTIFCDQCEEGRELNRAGAADDAARQGAAHDAR